MPREQRTALPALSRHAHESFRLHWQCVKACPHFNDLTTMGSFGYLRNAHADEDDRGGRVAWEVWHWPSNTVVSDWFTAADASAEVIRLHTGEDE